MSERNGQRGNGGGSNGAGKGWLERSVKWLVGLLLVAVVLVWSRTVDLVWPWHFQLWLVVLPLVEAIVLVAWGAQHIYRRTKAQLGRRETYAVLGAEDATWTDDDAAQVILGTANMPREPQSYWAYSGAMATRVTIRAWGQRRALLSVSVPAERAGEPIKTAWSLPGLELRPLDELTLEQEPPAKAVPVEEVPDV